MTKYLRNYKREVEEILKIGGEDSWDKVLKNHRAVIRFLQHERLIHLLVTLFFGLIFCLFVMVNLIFQKEGLILVNGIRFWEDFHFIKSYTRSYIIYVRVNQKLRWERVRNRGEKTDDKVSFEKFKEIDQNETERYVQKIGEKADLIIDNEKDLKYLLEKTDEVMGEINN